MMKLTRISMILVQILGALMLFLLGLYGYLQAYHFDRVLYRSVEAGGYLLITLISWTSVYYLSRACLKNIISLLKKK